ncbi:putative bifunctional diguanylate cyclase/phosphodiesterase [Denitromonas iodatirespirans]|uniref:EAL domain-containing protein n=1 Tax=Denitromonas iodatirespirans TaxID=2795389 RepID=A0A944D9U9_DENI1|nr:bifunctional diguanylate cyclase/phosphodiesterase [Denitromonas iodatirespirans]MBT0962465.1 EAL domain-containing protein [Denitromonas iodatirespirans]
MVPAAPCTLDGLSRRVAQLCLPIALTLTVALPGAAAQNTEANAPGTPVSLPTAVATSSAALLAALSVGLAWAGRRRSRALKAADEHRALLTALLDASPDRISFKDVDGRVQLINRSAAEVIGRPAAQILGRDEHEFFPAADAAALRQLDAELMASATAQQIEERVLKADGSHELYDTLKAPVRTADGQVIGLLGISRKITAERRTRDRLRLAARFFDNAAEGIVITRPDGVIELVNPAFTRITGYSLDEAVGQTPRLLQSGRHGAAFYQRLWDSLARHGRWQGEVWNRRKSGEIYPEWLDISPVHNNEGELVHYLGIFTDISTIKASEAQMTHMAQHDALTELPNRTLLNDRITTALRRAHRDDRRVAVIFLDLDHFKDINDSYGHAVGDAVLKQVAHRLVDCVREEDTVARLGGDEFVVLMEDIRTHEEVDLAAQRILSCLVPPIRHLEQEFFIGCSVGISLYPDDGQTVDALIRNADTAMYQAKQQGRNNAQRYHARQTEQTRHRVRMENALRHAIEQDALDVWYQPQVDLATSQLVGFEALCRWHDPKHGMVAPSEFIPLAEHNGLIVPLGALVLRKACAQICSWRAAGYRPPRVAVNVSGRQLRRLDFLSTVCAILDETGCRPEWIELEVTESDILKDAEPAIATLHGIREMGIALSLDDFGTGFSSLSYLKRLPINTLKIDRSFIDGLPDDGNDRAIVQAVLAMGRSLGIAVLAEGVETPAQVHALRLMGCGSAQGYHFGRPAVAADHTGVLPQA